MTTTRRRAKKKKNKADKTSGDLPEGLRASLAQSLSASTPASSSRRGDASTDRLVSLFGEFVKQQDGRFRGRERELSSSPSSSSDEGEGFAAADARFGHEIARDILSNIEAAGSAVQALKDMQVDKFNPRNKHECESLARIIDAFRADNVGLESMGFNLLVRRLAGVQMAEASNGDWAICDVIENYASKKSFVSPKYFKQITKDTNNLKAFINSGGVTKSKASSSSNSNNNNKKSSAQTADKKGTGREKQ